MQLVAGGEVDGGDLVDHVAQEVAADHAVLHTLEDGGDDVAAVGLHDGKREIALIAKQVIDALRRLAHEALPHRHNPPVGDAALFGDQMRITIPAGRLQFGHDVLSAGIGFVGHGYGGPNRLARRELVAGRSPSMTLAARVSRRPHLSSMRRSPAIRPVRRPALHLPSILRFLVLSPDPGTTRTRGRIISGKF